MEEPQSMDRPDSVSSSQGPPSAQTPFQEHHRNTIPSPLISTYGWDLQSLIARSRNFYPVQRVHHTSPNAKVDTVIHAVERDGNPMIIHGWNRHPQWPRTLFNVDWLRQNGDQNPTVRNVHNWADFKIPVDDFINKLRKTTAYASPDEQERLYGKDGECPSEWTDWLFQSGAIPESLLCNGSNDFLKFLPDKVQTLMCYMGIGDTFTPFHKDLCASSGQNLMCVSEHGGSAFWFMTKSSAAPEVAAYFHRLGQEVDLETHVVTIEELERAPFDVYIGEQHVGDLVLVPPRSCHQVVNHGGITIKTSWSRMSLNGLQTALWHELPIYHRVCRQEIYKVKSNIFHALQHFTKLAEDAAKRGTSNPSSRSMENLKQLVCLFDDILTAEFSISRDSMPHVSPSEVSHTDNLHCDFCGADIFQSFFECDSCLPAPSSAVSQGILPVGDGLVLCPLCYVEGRICLCESMQPVQCRPFTGLLDARDRAIQAIQSTDHEYTNVRGYLTEQPLRLLSEGDVNVFEAACKLFQKRQIDKQLSRSCRGRLSHTTTAPAAVYCKTCHSSRCYTHLLDWNSIHSVDAIILSDRYDGDANWHQSHRSSLQQYPTVRQRVVEDEERGSRPNFSHKLAYLAKTFTTCRTIAPGVTKHGWYDRFVQSTSIPIVNSPAKPLAGLTEQMDCDEQDYFPTPDDTPPGNMSEPAVQSSNPQLTDSGAVSRSYSGSAGNVDKVELAFHHGDSTNVMDPSSLFADENGNPLSSESATLQQQGSVGSIGIETQHNTSTSPCSPSSPRQPLEDDPGELSDLTELPTELESPLHKAVTVAPLSKSRGRRTTMRPFFPKSAAASSSASLTAAPKLRSRVVFDCVEIPQSGRYHSKAERAKPPSPRRKRKRASGRLLVDIAEPSDSDTLAVSAQEISSRTRSKSKRKTSQGRGPASRLLRTMCAHPFPDVQTPSRSSNHYLAQALNQTFQFNGTSAPRHVSTSPNSFDALSPVSNVHIRSSVKPQYRDIGVQKDLNFTRRTSGPQPAEDPSSSCIAKLEAENRELQTQLQKQKQDCEQHRENLDQLRSWCTENYVGPQSSPTVPTTWQRPPPSRAHVTPNCSPEASTHPRWRVRNHDCDEAPDRRRSYPTRSRRETASDSIPAHEPDHPPIETLPPASPTFPEAPSGSPHRQAPTEPRSFRAKRGEAANRRGRPYARHQPYWKRGGGEPMNGRRRWDGPRGPPSSNYRRGRSRSPVSPRTPPGGWARSPGSPRTPPGEWPGTRSPGSPRTPPGEWPGPQTPLRVEQDEEDHDVDDDRLYPEFS